MLLWFQNSSLKNQEFAKKIEIIKACPFLNFDFVLIWADVFLKMIMILKELRIAQPCSGKGRILEQFTWNSQRLEQFLNQNTLTCY